jgi:hypothetical protein
MIFRFSTIQYWMSEGKAVITRVGNISFYEILNLTARLTKSKK